MCREFVNNGGVFTLLAINEPVPGPHVLMLNCHHPTTDDGGGRAGQHQIVFATTTW